MKLLITPFSILLFFLLLSSSSSSFINAHNKKNSENLMAPPDPDPIAAVEQVPVHQCIHDSHIVPQMKKQEAELAAKGLSRPQARYAHPDGREAKTLAVGNMRFVLRTPDLYDTTKYCTAASGTVKDMRNSGTTIACSTTDDILTTEKRDLLVNTIIPAAIEELSYAFSVSQSSGNIIVPSTSACGSDYTIDSSDTTTGVADADFVLYVAASPIAGSTLAFAGYCSLDGAGRPVVGYMNFQPKHIKWNVSEPYTNHNAKRTIFHEILHAAGFSGSLLLSSPSSTTRRGKTVNEMRGPKTVACVQELLNCSTITGAELEGQGGSATMNSHLDSRAGFRDSVMSGILGDSRIDKTVLSIFDDSGLYTVNYSMAEPLVFGNNDYHGKGCGFADLRAGEPDAGLGDWCGDYPCPFCDQEGNTSMIAIDRRWVGPCTYMANLTFTVPADYQNFNSTIAGGYDFSYSLLDYAPTVTKYSNRVCDDPAIVPSASSVIYGWTHDKNARAVSTIGLVQTGYSFTDREARCLEFRCKSSDEGLTWYLEFRVQYDTWISCNTDGTFGPITVTGNYKGTVECPKASSMCNSNNPDMLVYDFSTTAAPPTNSTTTLTTTTLSTAAPPTTAVPPTTLAIITTPTPPTTTPLLGDASAAVGFGTSFVSVFGVILGMMMMMIGF